MLRSCCRVKLWPRSDTIHCWRFFSPWSENNIKWIWYDFCTYLLSMHLYFLFIFLCMSFSSLRRSLLTFSRCLYFFRYISKFSICFFFILLSFCGFLSLPVYLSLFVPFIHSIFLIFFLLFLFFFVRSFIFIFSVIISCLLALLLYLFLFLPFFSIFGLRLLCFHLYYITY
jgi:hypothetical protein